MNDSLKKITRTAVAYIVVVLIFSAMMGGSGAVAQNVKIGYVDPNVILNRMPEAKAVQQRLQNLAERKRNELAQKEQELQTEIELYQQKVGVISEEARQTEEQRLTQMDQEFRQLQSDVQLEIQQRQIELMTPLFEQIQASVNNVAATRGLDLVFNITTAGYGLFDRTIIHVSQELQEEYNITQAVIDDLAL